MARSADRLPENAQGDLFVDASCIDCDTCREIAPEIFSRASRGVSYVANQPGVIMLTNADRSRSENSGAPGTSMRLFHVCPLTGVITDAAAC